MTRITRLTEARKNEKGFSLVFVGLGCLALARTKVAR